MSADGASPLHTPVGDSMGEMVSWLAPIAEGLETVAVVIDLIGIAIILYGFAVSLFEFLRSEAGRLAGTRTLMGCRQVRMELGTYILLALEFMIASDIIHTVIKRELNDLIFVAALVAIRTAISFFLGKEIAEAAREEQTEQARS